MTSLAQMTSIGEIIAAKTSAVAWAPKMRRIDGLPSACPIPPRRRCHQPWPRSACAGGSSRLVASVIVMARKIAALTHSAALTP